MGLDNGIEIRRNDKLTKVYDKIKHFEDSWDKEHKYDIEIAYWRKCWNIRNLIANCIGGIYDCGDTPIDREQIPLIIETLKTLNEENWTEDGGSIWDYDEQKPFIDQHIKNLEYIYELMGECDLDIYFYDSY